MQIQGLSVSDNLTHFQVRAKYIPAPSGMKLALVQSFSVPTFRPKGWEDTKLDKIPKATNVLDDEDIVDEIIGREEDIERATRRAKINAFDIILCNPCLDTFATFTYRPDDDLDKSSYDECYKKLAVWLSNRVQRSGLMYVIVPERHKSGDIHFHGIMNSSALKLDRAYSPSGRPLKSNGKPVYNLRDWKHGFSTAQIIGDAEADREAVAKYVFKYMGKQSGQKIGGRYCLIGGQNIARPHFEYGDDVAEFIPSDVVAKYDREVRVSDSLEYREYSFI